MSQEQPRREQGQEGGAQGQCPYADVFTVTGDLADQPGDAATMQRGEYTTLGAPQPGGPAAAVASTATINRYTVAVGGNQASDVSSQQHTTVTETPVPGGKIVTEFVAGQVIGQYSVADMGTGDEGGGGGGRRGNVERRGRGDQGGGRDGGNQGRDDDDTKITIGEALEATARAIGNEPLEPSDAAAIRAAEVRATGVDVTMPGGVADEATAAATANICAPRDEAKIKIGDVLSHATAKMPADKPVEPEDAARVVGAELASKPDARTRPGGVAAAVATAARLNRDDDTP